MEDLVPFLIFIVIALINLVKFILEKGAGGKRPTAVPDREPPPREPSSLEEFFESLAEKIEPQPTELPDWPEGYERPDYMKEMEAFETTRAQTYEEEQTAEIIPMPEPEPARAEPLEVPGIEQAQPIAALKSVMMAMPSMITGSSGMRIKTAPMLRSSHAGGIDFPLTNKAELKKAIIANLVFGPPRAYDRSFDNTMAK